VLVNEVPRMEKSEKNGKSMKTQGTSNDGLYVNPQVNTILTIYILTQRISISGFPVGDIDGSRFVVAQAGNRDVKFVD
jgi:hypothetical protein